MMFLTLARVEIFCVQRGLKCSCNLTKIQLAMKFQPWLSFNSFACNGPLSNTFTNNTKENLSDDTLRGILHT